MYHEHCTKSTRILTLSLHTSPSLLVRHNTRHSGNVCLYKQLLESHWPTDHTYSFNGHFKLGLAGSPVNFCSPLVPLTCAYSQDRPKLSIPSLTSSHQLFLRHLFHLIPSVCIVICCLTQSASSLHLTCLNHQ